METWNFHAYVVLRLEEYEKKYIGVALKSADEIDHGEFVDTMLMLLSVKYGRLDDFKEFIEKCRAYDGVWANELSEENAQEIFEEFERLIKDTM